MAKEGCQIISTQHIYNENIVIFLKEVKIYYRKTNNFNIFTRKEYMFNYRILCFNLRKEIDKVTTGIKWPNPHHLDLEIQKRFNKSLCLRLIEDEVNKNVKEGWRLFFIDKFEWPSDLLDYEGCLTMIFEIKEELYIKK